MKTLIDYILDLKKNMDIVEGEETLVEILTIDDLMGVAIDIQTEAKAEMVDIGVTLATDDIRLINYVYETLAIYLYRNDSNRIMDEHEDKVDRFVALLLENSVPEEEIPDIMENILIDDKFNTILDFKYKDTTNIEISNYSKFLLSKLDNEFKYITPSKLIDAGLTKVFTVFKVEELAPIEVVYLLSIFEIDEDAMYGIFDVYPEIESTPIITKYNELKEVYENDAVSPVPNEAPL